MKTVIIPNDYHPFVIEVNGVKYTYPEGTEQSVPDEVASAIEHYYKLQPKEKPADGGVLPWVSKENDGDVLKVEDGVWKKAGGGLSESDFVMRQNGSTEDLTGFSAKDGTVYLPVIPETGQRLKRISSDGTTGLERETKLYVRNNASSDSPMTELAYEKKSVRYELSAAMMESLLTTGTANETLTIYYGVPAKLWDSIMVAVGDAELYCRRISSESTTVATYQGFVSSETKFGEGIFSLDLLVEKKPSSKVSFTLNFKKASGGGGGGNIFTMHVEYDDDAATVSVTETALEVATALENNAMLLMVWHGTGADYGYFDGVYIPYAYTTDGVYEGVAQDTHIEFRDYPTDDNGKLEYNHLTQTWSVSGIVS